MVTKIRFVVDSSLDQFDEFVCAGGDNLSNVVQCQKRVSHACTTCKQKEVTLTLIQLQSEIMLIHNQRYAVQGLSMYGLEAKVKPGAAENLIKRQMRNKRVSTTGSSSESPGESTEPSLELQVVSLYRIPDTIAFHLR
ncbi:hypothetical protein V1520DRAFT_375148 [Lipomyces starkeyi]|uniref:Uncharacterized protein n=1 Tax=Lipomyces starkeyi NRRL Y-11557 TaxID=675824 RepID=A0A1E3PV04_LIPST|nr:hypothetical protein LIPSTDRAFT_108154 [Lipomyces starkeyi NRRL Y-11557]